MKREEAHTLLEVMAIELTGELANSERPVTERTKLLGKQLKAIDMAIEALSAEQEDEPKFYDEDDYWNGRVPTHGRLIDANALMEYCSNQKTKTINNNDIARFPTIIADRPMWETCFACPLSNCCPKIQGATNEDAQKYAGEAPKGCPIDRPHGEWILECDSEGEGDNLYRCSECGCKYGCQEYDKPNFCLECGATMTKGGDSE